MSIQVSDLVIGLGEIGKPIFTLLEEGYGKQQVKGRDINGPLWPARVFKYLHICYPQVPDFPQTVFDYAKQYQVENIIIHATVCPAMLNIIKAHFEDDDYSPTLWYSPVRGNVQDGMLEGLRGYTKYIAPVTWNQSDLHPGVSVEVVDGMIDHMRNGGFNVKMVSSAEALVYAKIIDLAWYGTNIAFYQEIERMCEAASIPIDIIHEFIESTVPESGGKVSRKTFHGGFIGGHCVIPGIEKILGSYQSALLEAVLQSNSLREQELAFGVPDHHPKGRKLHPKNA